jgi:hypothetical protein
MLPLSAEECRFQSLVARFFRALRNAFPDGVKRRELWVNGVLERAEKAKLRPVESRPAR